jgi:anti-anti-sigma factor
MSQPLQFPGCSIRAYRNSSAIMIELNGVLRMQNSEELKQHLMSCMTNEVKKYYINLAKLTEIDSAGLGVLIGLHMTARKKKIDFLLASPTEPQMKLFAMTRVNTIFSVIGGIEAETVMADFIQDAAQTQPPTDRTL